MLGRRQGCTVHQIHVDARAASSASAAPETTERKQETAADTKTKKKKKKKKQTNGSSPGGGGGDGTRPAIDPRFEVVVGLETHVQLKTQTKAFCRCANAAARSGAGSSSSSSSSTTTSDGMAPNSLVCAVCLGHPGTLPVLNEEVKQLAIRVGVALDAHIASRSRFDRKQYFYADLPKGYQISQYAEPVVSDGELHVAASTPGETRRVRIVRAHIEEDSGKSSHAATAKAGGDTALTGSEYSLVDFNRAGIPLLEVVTAPDLRGGAEAAEYARELTRLLRCIGVSDCSMALGEFRCDVNVSVRKRPTEPGGAEEPLGTKVEVKNLNSFNAMQRAVDFEAVRQIAILNAAAAASGTDPASSDAGVEDTSAETTEAGNADAPLTIVAETRLWDEAQQVTRSMRKKETLADYRYFPEPDLPPLFVGDEEVDAARAAMPELPHERRRRIVDSYFGAGTDRSISAEELMTLCETSVLCEYFEHTVRLGPDPRETLNYLLRDITAYLNQAKLSDPFSLQLTPERFAGVLLLIADETISGKTAKEVLIPAIIDEGGEPADIVASRSLAQISDPESIAAIIDDVIVSNTSQLEQYLGGKTKLRGFFQGQLMKVSDGKINPKLGSAALDERLALEAERAMKE